MSEKKIPKQYLPKTLSPADRKKQKESIEKQTLRPKLDSAKTKRSRLVIAFEKKYGKKITDDKFISKNILKQKGIDLILDKGRGAYFSSGSRPNTTPEQWARARLAGVITGIGGARKVDKKIWDKYKI